MLKASWAGNLSVLLHAEPFREVLPLPCPDLVPRAKTIILGFVPYLRAQKLWLAR